MQLSACDAGTRLCSNAVESLGQPLPMHILHICRVHSACHGQCMSVSSTLCTQCQSGHLVNNLQCRWCAQCTHHGAQCQGELSFVPETASPQKPGQRSETFMAGRGKLVLFYDIPSRKFTSTWNKHFCQKIKSIPPHYKQAVDC